MNICDPIKELTEDEIIYSLKNKEKLIVSIHEKMYFIRKEVVKTEDIIEMASFHSSEITDMPSGKGVHKDLSDVLLKYYKYMDSQKKEFKDLFWTLTQREMRIERIWMCFLLLDEPYYTYIKRLYVDCEKYDAVEADSGFSRQVFGKYRKEAILLIMHFYNSDKSMMELSEISQRGLMYPKKDKKERQASNQNDGQISLMDILEAGEKKNE